jgi:hypothetical protein
VAGQAEVYGGATVGSPPEGPILSYGVLGAMSSHRKRSGIGERPHLGIVGHREAVACSCNDELLFFEPGDSVGDAPVVDLALQASSWHGVYGGSRRKW